MGSKSVKRSIVITINGKEVENTLNGVGKSIGSLKKELRGLVPGTDAFVNKSKELKKAQKAYKGINDEIRDTNVSLEEAQGHFSNLFGGLLSGNLQMVQSGLKGIAGNIKGMTKAAMSFIATPLGAAIAAVSSIAIGTKAWVDFNLEVEKTNQLIKDLTQETGLTVDAIRVRAEVLQETFGTDMTKSVTTAKSLVDNLGVSYDEAFDIIEDGAIRGKLKNDEFLDSLKEYPAQFKNAGFSAQEFGKIVNAGIDLSIYKDKLPDAIKEFTLSITEQTQAAQDALQNAFGKEFTTRLFNNIKTGATTPKEALQSIAEEAERIGLNSQQAQLLTADLFKGAGEDAGGALKVFEAVNKALNDQEKPLTEIQQLNKEQLEANVKLKGIYTQLFATADGGFGKLIAKGKIFATKTLIKILEGGVNLYNWFVDLKNESGVFSAMLTGFGKAATGSFKVIGIALSNAVTGFKGLGTVIQGVFSLSPEKIKKGFSTAMSVIPNMIKDIKNQVVEDATDIYDAFSGKNKSERISLSDLVGEGGTETSVTTPTAQTTTTGTGESESEELTPEDKRILASKKKLAEFLAAFDAEQDTLKQIEELEEDEAAQLKEELDLEAKYAKLEEQAFGETELLKKLEEAKKTELDAIDKKWNDKFLADNAKFKAAEQKQNEEAHRKQVAARKKLNNDILNGAINLAGQETRVGQALIAVKGILAAKETLINLGVLKDKVAMNAAGSAGAIAEGSAQTAKIGFPQNIPMIIGFAAQVVGIISAIKSATKQADEIKPKKAYFFGGHTGSSAVSYDQYGAVTGSVHDEEYVVPKIITQDPTYAPIINQLENKRVEATGQSNSLPAEFSSTNTGDNSLLTAAVYQLMAKLDEPLLATSLIGDNQINDFNLRNDQLKNVRNNAKVK